MTEQARVTNRPATMPVDEAAKELGISRSAFYRAVNRGDIPVIRLGKRILVPRPALEQILIAGNQRGSGRRDTSNHSGA